MSTGMFHQLNHSDAGEAELADIIMDCAVAASGQRTLTDPAAHHMVHLMDEIPQFYREIKKYFMSNIVGDPGCREQVAGWISDMQEIGYTSFLVCKAGEITTIHADTVRLLDEATIADFDRQRVSKGRHGLTA